MGARPDPKGKTKAKKMHRHPLTQMRGCRPHMVCMVVINETHEVLMIHNTVINAKGDMCNAMLQVRVPCFETEHDDVGLGRCARRHVLVRMPAAAILQDDLPPTELPETHTIGLSSESTAKAEKASPHTTTSCPLPKKAKKKTLAIFF
jgi:hypothetical protein